VSNYICLKPVKDIQMYPAGFCKGENSIARFTSLLYAQEGSILDVGAKAVLDGKNSRSEIISRVIAKDSSKIYSRGMLVGNNPKSKGHLECSGLLLGKRAKVIAVPELEGNVYGSELSHEAAVGKIADKELMYLMARGLSEEEATSVIIRGFLDTKIFGLPIHLQKYIDSLMDQMKYAGG
jgi:Fe-S cluster assembly scaffold protein SufB